MFRNLKSKRGVFNVLAGLAGTLAVENERQTGASERRSASLQRAAQLFGAAEAMRESIGAVIEPDERADYDRQLAILHAGLDPAALAEAWAAGRAMTFEQATAFALEGRPSE
jgi:hypothetical protein